MKQRTIKETSTMMFNLLVERFGDPIVTGAVEPDVIKSDELELTVPDEITESLQQMIGTSKVFNAWETLYIERGEVNVQELANFLGTSESVIRNSLPHQLLIDENDEIFEKGFVILQLNRPKTYTLYFKVIFLALSVTTIYSSPSMAAYTESCTAARISDLVIPTASAHFLQSG